MMNTIIGAAIIIGLPFPAACTILKLLQCCTRFSGKTFHCARWGPRLYASPRFRRCLPIAKVILLISFIFNVIAITSQIASPDLTLEDVIIAAASMVGLVLCQTYAIMFLCWTFKEFPEDKWWWWRLKICHIVSLVTILIAFICWIAFKGERCDSNFPTWTLLVPLMLGWLLALPMALPFGHSRSNGTRRANTTEREQGNGEGQELQIMRLEHSEPAAEPENPQLV
ncbi:uncharacterized protein LOC116990198 [Amblyraja radiata]|uniref:uncharacterized protein LOC116990198 n=1 Tax=Amblyraja radiata TaxID=386614 RepID=UPI0014021581|nr:uncharacterized protein LOC116990198 [Amblyraja radiata]